MSYSTLLHHLHHPKLQAASIQSALAFHIANLSPLPTPLVATAITCPLFLSHPFSLSRLQALSASFRHALHLKLTLLSAPNFSLFERSISTRLTQWTNALLKGLQGGNPLLRLAAAAGVLLAFEDIRSQANNPFEDQVVIAFAEVMEQEGQWESEFQSTALFEQDLIVAPLTLSVILASQSLPLVASQKLKALPLTALSQLLTLCIAETFNEGEFLRESAASTALRPHIASLSRLEALVLSLELGSSPREGLSSAQDTLNRMLELASRVEVAIPRFGVETAMSENSSWLTLKTILFSIVMISDAVLSACIYIPPTTYRYSPTSSLSSPASLSQTILLTLSRLSFIVSQFGGISSMGTAADASSFKEMRKTAYLALDILASGSGSEDVAERFVDELASNAVSGVVVVGSGAVSRRNTPVSPAFICFGSPFTAREFGFGFEYGGAAGVHSWIQLKRQVFESAHSVVLAMLAANAANADVIPTPMTLVEDVSGKDKGKEKEDSLSAFCTRLVPFYAKCLIENSAQGKLSTPQLRIAYAALVRSAASATRFDSDSERPSQFVLAWYCIEELLGAIRNLRDNREQQHRLHLTLISCVSALPLALLGRVLDEVNIVLSASSRSESDLTALQSEEQNRAELVQALYRERKEYVLRWWSTFAIESKNEVVQDGGAIAKL
ncbi:hypothetical protein BT96DRAFT_915910 [Gymnopus androsaceus JB14]|uniref:Uncharacterized protein n=1 Tax=Gymnopus androsaceus JB14 TaxID=1447944 RepID=A0A6A4I1R8_9AGAR|nr:hypothetical protein BT96DRAFT_915910 [Gymnopus androsaceus JB14]